MDENGTQTWTLYEGSDPIMDFNSSSSLEMRYLNGPTGDLVDSVIARESSGGTVAWYLPDRLGTIRDLINNSGSIIDHIDFSAFGTVLDQSAPSEGDRMMGFGGMELDSVTGTNLAVNRVQNPGTGRWTSQDPLGFEAGDTSLYRYSRNEPTAWGDPEGLAPRQKKTKPPVGVGKFPSPTPIGVTPTLPQVLASPCMQRLMRQLHLAHKNGEQGRFVLYNPITGQIWVTTRGIQGSSHYNVKWVIPKVTGWIVIGRVHTHSSGKPVSPEDLAGTEGTCPGAVIWQRRYQSYERRDDGDHTSPRLPYYWGPLRPIIPPIRPL